MSSDGRREKNRRPVSMPVSSRTSGIKTKATTSCQTELMMHIKYIVPRQETQKEPTRLYSVYSGYPYHQKAISDVAMISTMRFTRRRLFMQKWPKPGKFQRTIPLPRIHSAQPVIANATCYKEQLVRCWYW